MDMPSLSSSSSPSSSSSSSSSPSASLLHISTHASTTAALTTTAGAAVNDDSGEELGSCGDDDSDDHGTNLRGELNNLKSPLSRDPTCRSSPPTEVRTLSKNHQRKINSHLNSSDSLNIVQMDPNTHADSTTDQRSKTYLSLKPPSSRFSRSDLGISFAVVLRLFVPRQVIEERQLQVAMISADTDADSDVKLAVGYSNQCNESSMDKTLTEGNFESNFTTRSADCAKNYESNKSTQQKEYFIKENQRRYRLISLLGAILGASLLVMLGLYFTVPSWTRSALTGEYSTLVVDGDRHERNLNAENERWRFSQDGGSIDNGSADQEKNTLHSRHNVISITRIPGIKNPHGRKKRSHLNDRHSNIDHDYRADDTDEVSYQFQAFGRTVSLDLERQDGFYLQDASVFFMRENEFVLMPSLRDRLIEFLPRGSDSGSSSRSTTEVVEEADSDGLANHCFRSGSVREDPQSVAVVSTCGEMTGVIQMWNKRYIIEPLEALAAASADTPTSGASTTSTTVFMTTTTPTSTAIEDVKHVIYEMEPLSFKDMLYQESLENKTQQEARNSTTRRMTGGNLASNNENRKNESETRLPHGQGRIRSKRSFSMRRHVEVMVAADSSMHEYHGDNLEKYLLTLMAIVNNMYRDKSVGNYINIIVVRIILLDSNLSSKMISSNAAATLKGFCSWQHEMNNAKNDEFGHHDTAILFTRSDICRSKIQCDTLGLAELGTMCNFARSCSIVEDNGFSTAFTVAHELGHVLNLRHDNDGDCNSDTSDYFYLMARTIDNDMRPWQWSSCSRERLIEFFDSGKGECLTNVPRRHPDLTLSSEDVDGQLPGVSYSAHQQCAQIFDKRAYSCSYLNSCSRLWCTDPDYMPNGCKSQPSPMADGTPCGGKGSENRCFKGQCVEAIPMIPLDGKWGNWLDYEPCTRTCGGGIQKAVRLCNSPAPENGGKYCLGKRAKYRSCNHKNCPEGSADFRDSQCKKFNGKHFNIKGLSENVTWVAKYTGIVHKDKCKLFCQVEHTSAYYLLAERVQDGTKCSPDTSDICILGQCRKAGCDNRLGSFLAVDRCGVCGGNNSLCHEVRGFFPVDTRLSFGYNFVVKIPVGATSVVITQYGYPDDNLFLALKDGNEREVLNNNLIVCTYKKEVDFNGTILHYSGSGEAIERVNVTTALKSDLLVYVLSNGDLSRNIDIRWEYMVRRNDETAASLREDVVWKMTKWSECSRICEGTQYRMAQCLHTPTGNFVSDGYCWSLKKKPPASFRTCQLHCKLNWVVTNQTACSGKCNRRGTMEQEVKCKKENIRYHSVSFLDEGACRSLDTARPPSVVPCTGSCSTAQWKYSQWSQCSKSCGGGLQIRTAECTDSEGRSVASYRCKGEKKKLLVQGCNQEACPKWVQGEWSGCSTTCGVGQMYRTVECYHGDRIITSTDGCDPREKPPLETDCDLGRCPSWIPGKWSQCSATCGISEKSRRVSCHIVPNVIVDDSNCDPTARPQSNTRCPYVPCITPIASALTLLVTPNNPPLPSPNWSSHNLPAPGHKIRGTRMPYYGSDPYASQLPHPPAKAEDNGVVDWSGHPLRPRIGGRRRSSGLDDYDDDDRVDNDDDDDVDEEPVTTWRTGSWTECSTTCGEGSKRRYVSCRDHEGSVVPDYSCEQLARPISVEACKERFCGQWRTGDWTKCPPPSDSCGDSNEATRYVACVLIDARGELIITLDSDCDPRDRPTSKRVCHSEPCHFPTSDMGLENPKPDSHENGGDTVNRWVIGEWSQCSHMCGGGVELRFVVCQDWTGDTLEDSYCQGGTKPINERSCNPDPCPSWVYGDWGACSTTCGKGVRSRLVQCRWRTGMEASKVLCEGFQPPSIEACQQPPCFLGLPVASNFRPHWVKKPWSQCSVTCGRGKKTREINCIDEKTGVIVDERECLEVKPNVTSSCRVASNCYRWKTTSWGKCSKACESGVQKRQLTCIDRSTGIKVIETYCKSQTRPEVTKPCNNDDENNITRCPTILWVASPWSQCSKSCGQGHKTRAVKCTERSTNLEKPPFYCTGAKRPYNKTKCYLRPCPFTWISSDWTPCSVSCGNGVQKRAVTCRGVTPEGWLQVGYRSDSLCDLKSRPALERSCNLGGCNEEFRYETGSWSQCSKTCGSGQMSRQYYCTHRRGQRVNEIMCSGIPFVPDVTKSCYLRPCESTSCKNLQKNSMATVDDDYMLVIGGQLVNIYCHGMSTSNPKEYISLVANENENFSEIYDRRLFRPNSCPANGSRLAPNCTSCFKAEPHRQSGLTKFSKLRLNITSLHVIVDDYKFATKSGLKNVPYATAGDCYSKARSCPQGSFSIDLTGTRFTVSPTVEWSTYGSHANQDVRRSPEGQVVKGICGGYCGGCHPKVGQILQLQLML